MNKTADFNINNCDICPRKCHADRERRQGFCGGGKNIKLARAALHYWEEPCISGKNGSGTVFFSGCVLKCCFCQNYNISAQNYGKEVSIDRLSDIFLELEDKGANNINLVSATQYMPWVLKALDKVKNRLSIPVVYNTGGYETIESIKALDGYVDIFLPDLKYHSSELSEKYSFAKNYFEVASHAIMQMYKQVGKPVFKDNLLKKGMIVRHLTLPCARHDSVEIFKWLSQNFAKDDILVSLMSQYTPFYKSSEHKEINRRISTFEYNYVLDYVNSLGFKGYMQEKSSAKEEYTPVFDLSGI